VPYSDIPLTDEEKKEQNTTTYSSNVSITKLEDGKCSIEQDLSNVGMEGHKATSYFSCGETAFDKSFREHMEKVKNKLKGSIKRD
ncbi:MAG: hypothetical protein ACPGSN_01065, partial [Psychrobium sp.]